MDPKYPDAPKLEGGTTFSEGIKYQLEMITAYKEALHWPIHYYETRDEQYKIGESIEGIEIKLDNRIPDTGNLSIEIAERTRDDDSLPWTPSGILRPDNTIIYNQGHWEKAWVFPKVYLQAWYLRQSPKKINTLPTIKRVLMKVCTANKLAIVMLVKIDGHWYQLRSDPATREETIYVPASDSRR